MLVIRAGQLIDGNGGPPMRDAVVLVEGERIVKVGLPQEVEVLPKTEIIDASGKTVIPGMIDSHVHVDSEGGPAIDDIADRTAHSQSFLTLERRNTQYAIRSAADQIAHSQGFLALRAYSNVRRDLEMGFTSVRSLGSPAYVDVALRDAITAGLVEGPRIRAAGQALGITGGHMDLGHWAPEVSIFGRTGVCDGPWECRKAAREQLKRGADLIKIGAAGEWQQEMTYEEMAAICEEAHWAKKRVAAHAYGAPDGQGITDAIRAGLDSVEHGAWLTDEQVDMMAERGVFYVPTLSVHTRGLELGKELTGLSSALWDWLLKACEAIWASLERAKKAGVKIATGTDAGFWMYHGENAKELAELVKGGFTPMEAIVAATRTGAECLDLDRDTGTIEEGKYADLVIVDGDPLADIKILQDKDRIVQVLKGGQKIKHNPIDDLDSST